MLKCLLMLWNNLGRWLLFNTKNVIFHQWEEEDDDKVVYKTWWSIIVLLKYIQIRYSMKEF
jgi:hypothetical protein